MSFWGDLDTLLRGRIVVREGPRLLRNWLCWQVLASALFGVSVGVFALTRPEPEARYLLASAVKMPLLLLFTTLVTGPSLYVFGALRGLRFSALEFMAMLVMAQTVLAAVLGSLAPVVAFFGFTTRSYSFMVLLTVMCCALGGLLGLRAFLASIGKRVDESDPPPLPDVGEGSATDSHSQVGAPAKPELARAARVLGVSSPPARQPGAAMWQVLSGWLILYLFVGAQMSWILRPFVGDPKLPFVFLRGKDGNFLEGVFSHLQRLLGG